MKSRILGTLLCILVLGATFWLISKTPSTPPEIQETQEEETYVPPKETIKTEITRAYVIETAHNAEDLFDKLAYEGDTEYKKTIENLSERLKKSATFLKDELQDYHGAAYFTKLSEVFQELIDKPFDNNKSFAERTKKFLNELENAYPEEAAKNLDENDPNTPMYYPKFDTKVSGKTTLALLSIYRMQYQESNNSILLTFGGNLVTGDSLLDVEKNDSFKNISSNSKLPYPLYMLSPLFSTDAASFANLAVPLTDSVGDADSAGSVKGDASYAKLLKSAGIDVVSIANSDVLSYGESGKADTISALNDASLSYTEEGKIVFVETKLGKVAYISYDIIDETGANKKDAFTEAPKKDIAAAKEDGAVFVIVNFNWTNSSKNSWDPSKVQVQTARAAVDNGANLVFGTHPSAIEAIERYKNVCIVYSAGDLFRKSGEKSTSFIFQQSFSLDDDKKPVPGEIFVIPLTSSNNNENLPVITFDKESVETFKKVIKNSSSTVIYGVGKNQTFTTDHLNILTIE